MNDQKHGHGIFVWPNGKVYNGGWFMGKQHGQALFTNEKEEVRQSIWEDGKCIKWLQKDKLASVVLARTQHNRSIGAVYVDEVDEKKANLMLESTKQESTECCESAGISRSNKIAKVNSSNGQNQSKSGALKQFFK